MLYIARQQFKNYLSVTGVLAQFIEFRSTPICMTSLWLLVDSNTYVSRFLLLWTLTMASKAIVPSPSDSIYHLPIGTGLVEGFGRRRGSIASVKF